MEGSGDYLIQLDSALEERRRWLESTELPRLKDALSSYEALFDGAAQMLIRKGLLREDPYNYEQAFTDIVLPSDDTLPEFENSDELSYRIAGYQRQVRFLAAEYPLDIKTLNLARLKKISSLMSYINWSEFTEASKSPTTRGFVHAFVKVRMGSDSMAAQILKDTEGQITRTVNQIRGTVGGLIAFYRESWKSELRHVVLPDIALSSTTDTALKKDEVMKAIRHDFAQKMIGKPWYPALAEEVAMEELAPDGPQRKQKAIASLALPAETPKAQAVVQQDPHAILLDAVKLLCRPHEELATAIAVLEENEKALHETKPSGGWLRRLFSGGNEQGSEDHTYKVQYADPGSSTPKSETIDLAKLGPEVEKKAALMAALYVGSGPAYRKLAGTEDSSLAGFVDKQLNELAVMHRRLECLNTLFQARATLAKRQTRGIKIELLTIKNSIVKANQKRHDYGGSGAD